MDKATKKRLREAFQTNLISSSFDFLGYSVQKNVLILQFQLGEILFENRDEFSINLEPMASTYQFRKLALFYGMAKAFQYVQHFLVSELRVHNSLFDEQEENFWKIYYEKYSMELFYSQKIPLDFLCKISFYREEAAFPHDHLIVSKKTILLGVGGGKDAIYAYETLEQSKIPTALFYTYETNEEYELRHALTQQMSIKYNRKYYWAKRNEIATPEIRDIIARQKKAGIKPSAPAASTNAIRMAIFSLSEGFGYISTCNEKSADFGNTIYKGKEVNHQYSKSLSFEKALGERLQAIIPGLQYFSILKPLYEVRIVQGFSKLTEYHSHFNSCNRNAATWCLSCSKCAFIYVLLAAFLRPEQLSDIFQENLFNKPSLKESFLELMGLVGIKPLECVGEKEEVWLALFWAKKYGHTGTIIDMFHEKVLPSIDVTALEKKYMHIYDKKTEHCIPSEILRKVQWI